MLPEEYSGSHSLRADLNCVLKKVMIEKPVHTMIYAPADFMLPCIWENDPVDYF